MLSSSAPVSPVPAAPAPTGPAPLSLLWSALVTLVVLPGLMAPAPALAEAVPAAEPAGWMGSLSDDVNLAELSIPGTHDSAAWRGTVWSRTQDLTIAEQLDAGVRFLDVRTRHYRDAFPLHHGAEYLHLNFTDVVVEIGAFLDRHPTETVLIRLKKEHTEEENTRSYEETLDHYIEEDPGTRHILGERLWAPPVPGGTRVPDLGEVRGRIVIVQDFPASRDYGIRWNGSALSVQDDYRVPTLFDIPAKWEKARVHLDAAASGPPGTLYVNHLSGSGAPFANPREVAWGFLGSRGVNTYAVGHLRNAPPRRTGIVVMDFPDRELIDRILVRNPG
ncbi:phosphatidylinositol-specific phospholipase C [Nocardiopsis lambiniae]|uniref:1-phosphatidylinositol phosphodiesterase n=1 Tax=Nocardiopsis lambiniae TaxID=3075539 RepID=A0ABU2M9L8_9ACTN|nr:phosphatidylinositol-specific phospholipase C [Nocardiopsis sp. DSM 44743]MDT0329358.1 phosphatidylinositol-specific phospholipase C [Nocardiopsis sp. DSM 44743]